MQSEEVRKRFLQFFSKHGHAVVPSSSLVPSDPSVLLTTAGMQQFKPYFTGELSAIKDFGSASATSIQKCFRTSDIDEVGDASHLTMFEMLGNFSFGYPSDSAKAEQIPKGSYFKAEAIRYGFEFVTQELGLAPENLYVTVFAGEGNVPFDRESFDIWHKQIGIPADRIFKHGRKDNFWGPTGSEGPCGPSTEIYVAKTLEGATRQEGLEVWNIVFNQYYQDTSGNLATLPHFGIDTGAGFERMVSVVQGVSSVYDTDLFAGLMAEIRNHGTGLPESAVRIIADHFRSAVFLIADGVRPSNKDAGYILRRLLRKVFMLAIKHDLHTDLIAGLLGAVVGKFGPHYPELKNPEIEMIIREEQVKFAGAVAKGTQELKRHPVLNAKEAFTIATSLGLNFELIKELAPEATKDISQADFDREFREHQEISRAGAEKKFGGHGLLLDTGELKAKDEAELKIVTRLHTATHLLQSALRQVLGTEVKQAGSDITAERTRFDFTFPRKLTTDEIKAVEKVVNEAIASDLPVSCKEMPKTEAVKTGALYFFKAKYGETVKVYYMGHTMETAFSKEFCGGPHVDHTSLVGKFRIAKEEAVSAGVRRIRGVVE